MTPDKVQYSRRTNSSKHHSADVNFNWVQLLHSILTVSKVIGLNIFPVNSVKREFWSLWALTDVKMVMQSAKHESSARCLALPFQALLHYTAWSCAAKVWKATRRGGARSSTQRQLKIELPWSATTIFCWFKSLTLCRPQVQILLPWRDAPNCKEEIFHLVVFFSHFSS